jgi:hypothetical protein
MFESAKASGQEDVPID